MLSDVAVLYFVVYISSHIYPLVSHVHFIMITIAQVPMLILSANAYYCDTNRSMLRSKISICAYSTPWGNVSACEIRTRLTRVESANCSDHVQHP